MYSVKSLSRPPLLACLVAVQTLLPASQLTAATISKANNTEALDSASSWDGGVVPGSGDLAAFGSANTADSTPVTIGSGVNFLGIIASNSLGANLTVNAGAAGTLNLVAGGIDFRAMTLWRNLTINSTVALSADQTWLLGTNGSTNPNLLNIGGVISGPHVLTIDGMAGNDGEHVYLQANNTFSGGFTLGQHGAVRVSASGATASAGAVTAGSLGTGPVSIDGGIIFGNSGLVGAVTTTINADFAVNRGPAGGANNRLRLFGGFDLAGGERTVSLGRYTNNPAAVLGSGSESLKFETVADGPVTTFTNGTLRFVRDATGGAGDYASVRFESGTGVFNGNSGLVIGSNVITVLPSGFVFGTFGERPDIEVEAGGYLNLSDQANARDAAIEGLSGEGTVTSLASATDTATLTIQPRAEHVFSGRLVDGSALTDLVPAAAAPVALTINGGGSQILTGDNSYSGPTTITSGTLVLAATNGAAAGNSSAVTVAANGVLRLTRSEQIADTAPLTLDGGALLMSENVSETAGALTVSAPPTITMESGSGSTLAFGTYSPTELLTILNLGGGNKITFQSDLSTAVTNPVLFAFPDGYSASWDAATGTFTIAEAEPNLTVGTAVTGATPQILGYNMGTFWEGSNTPDWWRYGGVNAARMFLNPSNFELQGEDGVTTSAQFLAEKAALQSDPLNYANIDWAHFEDSFVNRHVTSGSTLTRYKADHTIRTLRDMGVAMLMQISASEGYFVINDANDWGGKWQMWKHYYAMAYYLARHLDVHRFQMFNEPDHPNANGLLPENWLMRLQIVRDAVDSAIADVNRLHGKNLTPLIYAPTTADSRVQPDWGGFALHNIGTDFLGQTPPGYRLFDRYNYHQYNSNPGSFGDRVATNKAAVAAALAGEETLPLAISEWNVHTSAFFEDRPNDTLDTPSKYARFGAIAARLAANQLDEMFVFKFTQTASASNASGVVKNGMHHTDWDNAPFHHGGITQAAEAYRLFNRAAAPGGQLLSFTATGDASNLDIIVTRQDEGTRYYVYAANQGPDAQVLSIDCSAWNLPEGAFATLQQVSPGSNGGVIAVDRVTAGRLPARALPGYGVRLYTIETVAAQDDTINVSDDALLADGSNAGTNFGTGTDLRARNDAGNTAARHVAALKFQLPLVHGPDILQAVLTLPASADGTTEEVQAHVYGMKDDAWSEETVRWTSLPALRQGIPAGNKIANNVVDNGENGLATIQGQLVTAGATSSDAQVDVTDFVRERLSGGAASFLVAQDARWDLEIINQTPGDTQPGGVSLVSQEAATDLQPASRLKLIRRTDTDKDGISDEAERNEFGTSPSLPDTDRDGLSDGEEILQHGTDPLAADSDGDRQNDRAELLLGTNPLDPSSVWSSRGELSGDSFTMHWPGATGLTFHVRRSLDLPSGWTTIHSVDGIAGPMSYTDPDPLGQTGFYRVDATE